MQVPVTRQSELVRVVPCRVWRHTKLLGESVQVGLHSSGASLLCVYLSTQEVTALAVHPHNDIVASGQAGKEAIVCLFDASCRVQDRHAEAEADSPRTSHAGRAEKPRDGDKVTPPMFLRELSLGKKEKRGVSCPMSKCRETLE